VSLLMFKGNEKLLGVSFSRHHRFATHISRFVAESISKAITHPTESNARF
jgi:hypothetical protein